MYSCAAVEGTAALVSRIALALYVVFYGAWEAMYGIGLGILADAVNGLPPAERATGAEVIQDYGENIFLRGLGVPDYSAPAAFRPHRSSALHRRRPAVRA
jgi:hypothetical protein